MDGWKYWVFDSKNRPYTLSGLVILFLVLPIALILVNRVQNYRSSAAAADKLETEGGTLSGNAQSKPDSQASGGSYIELGINSSQSPTPTPQTGLNYPPDRNPLSASTPPSMSRPGYLNPVTEPSFGTKITRVTDISKFGSNTARHHYSKDAVWNRDGSKMMIGKHIIDGRNYQYIKLFSSLTGEYRWSNTDPNKILAIEADGEFRIWDVNSSTNTLVRTFSGYDEVRMGPWEGNISNDDRYVVLSGRKGTDYTAIVFDIANNSILGTKTFPGLWDNGIDWVSISPSGRYVVINTAKCVNGSCGGNFDLYDKNMNFVRTAINQIAHADMTVDTDGKEYIVMVLGVNGRITKVNLDTGEKTILLPNLVAHGHISCRNLLRPGWCYSTLTVQSGAGWQQAFAFKLDGSGTVEQFANHRSSVANYNLEPHGSVSFDGAKIIWASDWLQNDGLVHDYVAESY